MEARRIECLRCGDTRTAQSDEPECPRCGYLGWAHTDDLTEPIRKLLRKRPPEVRRLHVAQ
jgi:hypothetical protein